MIHMLSVFRGFANENPCQHIREFEDICGTMKYNQMTEESLKLKLFHFSLKEKAKTWLLSLQSGSISTWEELAEAYYRKFYSKQKTATMRQALNTFHQLQGEMLFIYFERFKDLLLEHPHHGFEKICLIQILYEGLDYSNKTMIESLYNGTFISKTADDAWQFFEEVAENTL